MILEESCDGVLLIARDGEHIGKAAPTAKVDGIRIAGRIVYGALRLEDSVARVDFGGAYTLLIRASRDEV